MGVEEEKRFEAARKQLVAKRVDAIQQGRNSFTLVEQKAVNYMISKIKPTDSPDTEYYFNVGEFCRMIQWHRHPTKEILTMLENIANKQWWVSTITEETGEVEHELRHWFDVVRLNETEGIITITFSKTVHPYLFNLLEQQKKGKVYIASWSQDATALMKNQYSSKLFELLLTYELNNVEWVFENGTGTERDLQVILANTDSKGKPIIPKGWSNWNTFNRNVLEPAKREINKYTDILIDYEPRKIDFAGRKHRKYVAINFRMSEKSPSEKEEKDRKIAVEYDNVISGYEQMTLDDFQIKEKNENEDWKKREDIIEKSSYPLLKSEFFEFTDEQLHVLDLEAQKHIEECAVPWKCRELWVVDYIMEYYNYVMATPDQTKTNAFARLRDCVRNDYHHHAYRINSKYDRMYEKEQGRQPDVIDMEEMEQSRNDRYEVIHEEHEEVCDIPLEREVHHEVVSKNETEQDLSDEALEEKLLSMIRKIGV